MVEWRERFRRASKRLWAVGCGAVILSTCCGISTLSLGRRLVWPAEARAPFPGSELLAASSSQSVQGWRVVRVYHVEDDMRNVVDWYRGELGASARLPETAAERCIENRITAPAPRLALRPIVPAQFWALRRTTDVRFCPTGGSVEVTTRTYYRWQAVGP